ncbi:ArsR family transcriptional regulator [Oceanococcus atlanticus]|uniref:ArsR family transcriptional regulator n=1 Tax=Oceanococcus atlanticus TaxID=1317117 RepID=A0A1Y1SDQ6_9GAMM|nr:metalloregulator ArsR/SmtB family transcription factor [Oceanococcus atlanticus]ORE87127.1 ArsR family transcriptional regulator [Oceanococcus atlanticus]
MPAHPAPINPAEMAEHADAAAGLLKALANPNRLMVLCLLADGELSVGQLNEQVPLTQSALSQHLAVLRRDGLVQTRRDAQTVYYSAQPGPAAEIIAVLHRTYCGHA